MSGNFNGPLSHIGQEFARHAALPPDKKAAARTSYGSFLLVACAYTAFEIHGLVQEYPLVFTGVAGFGLILLTVGLRGPRGPVEVMTHFWSGFWAVAFGALSWWLAVARPEVWGIFWVRCGCLSFAIAQGLEFLLRLRPAASGALPLVEQNIERNRVDMRPANGRRR